MKRSIALTLVLVMNVLVTAAAPLRVVLLDCEDQTGGRTDSVALGTVTAAELARKGALLVGKELVKYDIFDLIDRRDFTSRINTIRGRGMPGAANRDLFLHAAQALRADAALRSMILSFSTGKRIVNQGGYQTELITLSLRVMLEVLDVTDGSIIAMADGVATRDFRITPNDVTVIGEDEALQLMEQAIAKALPAVEQNVQKRIAKLTNRSKVRLTIKSSADPAMVEIDGILVGSTPLNNYAVYKGDHIITIGRPGYQDVSKRILLENDISITVPMLRTELTMEELKEVLMEMRYRTISVLQPAWVVQDID